MGSCEPTALSLALLLTPHCSALSLLSSLVPAVLRPTTSLDCRRQGAKELSCKETEKVNLGLSWARAEI